jgi:hypothetical protein
MSQCERHAGTCLSANPKQYEGDSSNSVTFGTGEKAGATLASPRTASRIEFKKSATLRWHGRRGRTTPITAEGPERSLYPLCLDRHFLFSLIFKQQGCQSQAGDHQVIRRAWRSIFTSQSWNLRAPVATPIPRPPQNRSSYQRRVKIAAGDSAGGGVGP